MGEMTTRESWERFEQGLSKSISRGRELAKASGRREWNQISFQLEGILNKGREVYNAKATSDSEVARLLNQIQQEIKV